MNTEIATWSGTSEYANGAAFAVGYVKLYGVDAAVRAHVIQHRDRLKTMAFLVGASEVLIKRVQDDARALLARLGTGE